MQLLIDIVGDIGTVRADCYRQFHDIKFRIEVDLFFFKNFPEAAFKLISPCIASFLLFPVQIVQGLEHVFLTIYKIAEQPQENYHDKIIKRSHYLRIVESVNQPQQQHPCVKTHDIFQPVERQLFVGEIRLQLTVEPLDSEVAINKDAQ